MTIHTSRFGVINVLDDDIINFPEGLLGFNELRRFVLLDDPTDEIFAWLQSCDEPGIAFPLLEPELFTATYKVQLTKHDLEILGLKTDEAVRAFSIITIPADPTQMTANLKAPDSRTNIYPAAAAGGAKSHPLDQEPGGGLGRSH